jgi:transcription antitermination factor NusG
MADTRLWFALRVAPHTLRPVTLGTPFGIEWALERAGVTSWLIPFGEKRRQIHRYSHHRIWIKYPVLSSYVFVATHSLDDLWNRLWYVPTVKAIVGTRGERPRPILESAMDVLKAKLLGTRSPQSVGAHQPAREFEIGDTGRMTVGPFLHHRIQVEELREDAAKVLMVIFGSPQHVWVPIDAIEHE